MRLDIAATENDVKIGMISIDFDVNIDSNEIGAIVEDFHVIEEYRKKGVGTKLVKATVDILRDYDKKIVVHCNDNSIRIFKKLGFIEKESYTILVKDKTLLKRLGVLNMLFAFGKITELEEIERQELLKLHLEY